MSSPSSAHSSSDLVVAAASSPPSRSSGGSSFSSLLSKLSWRHASTVSLSLLGRSGPKVPLTWLLAVAALWLSWVAWQRNRVRRRQRQHQQNLELYWSKFHHYIRFGFDIGGTLCKLVYFEPDEVSAEQAAVKARVDAFIKGSVTYGQTGNRDELLQFSCRQIHGTLHFLKFQTAMMANFIAIVKQHNLSPLLPHDADADSAQTAAAAAALETRPTADLRSAPVIDRSRSVGSRRLSLPSRGSSFRGGTAPALISSSAAVLSFSTAPSTKEQARGSRAAGVQTASTATAASSSSSSSSSAAAPRVRPKLGATAWYTLTDPASPTLQPAVALPSSSSFSSSTLPSLSSAEHSSLEAADGSSSTPDANGLHEHHMLASSYTSPPPASSTSSSLWTGTKQPAAAADGTTSLLHSLSNGIPPAAATNERQTSEPASIASTAGSPSFSSSLSTVTSATSMSSPSSSSSSLSSSSGSAGSSGDTTTATTASSSSLSSVSSPSGSDDRLPPIVCGTGGGAYKFASLFASHLHVELEIMDELESLVKGIDFMIHTVPDECYFLSQFLFKLPLQRSTHPPLSYPYLVCNIGSGVSILKVSGPHQFERVGGTSLGGGTFLGLCRALTGCETFAAALQLAEAGHSSAVDLLVGDIYGGDYDALGLAKENVAASFGKLVRGEIAVRGVRKEDLAKAALVMITNNISSLVNLYAHQVLHVPQMIFVGNFLTHNEIAKRGLAFATDYWSQQTAKALFLRHEGYFGAVGSLLA